MNIIARINELIEKRQTFCLATVQGTNPAVFWMYAAQAAEAKVKHQPQIEVFQEIRAIGGKRYKRGIYFITLEEAGDLEVWLHRMNAQLAHKPPSELGFHVWPPFKIDHLLIDPVEVERPPGQARSMWGPREQQEEHALSREPAQQ